MTKECTKCNYQKDITLFKLNKNGKYNNNCIDCDKKYKSIWYENNKERLSSIYCNYRIKNKEYYKEYNKKYKEDNKEYFKKYSEIYYNENVEIIKERTKEYYINNKEKCSDYNYKYYVDNKKSISDYKNIYMKSRKSNDILFRIKCNMRALILNSINRNGFKKNSKTEEILGCCFDGFKNHIESKFEDWMSWENYGRYNGELNYGWDIDHIIPSSSAKTEEEIIILNHFKNLQPLCSKVNRDIKKNKKDEYKGI